MGKIKVVWNKDCTRSVVLQKMKEFSIEEFNNKFLVKGWYNKDNCFLFGDFGTREEAEIYLGEIHKLF